MLIRQSVVYVAGWAVPAVVSFVTLAAYSRLLEPDAFGTYALTLTGISVCFSITMLWMCSATLRLLRVAPVRTEFLAGLAATFAAITAVLGIPVVIALCLTSTDDRVLILLAYAAFIANGWLELNLHMLRAELKAAQFALCSAVRAIVPGVGGVALAAAGYGIAGILVATILGTALPALWLTRQYWRGVPLRLPTSGTIRELFKFGAPLSLGYSLESMLWYADRILLGVLAGTTAVGLYAAGFDMANKTLKGLMSAVGSAGLGLALNELEEQAPATVRRQLTKNFAMLYGVGLPAVVGMICLRHDMVGLLGADYRAAGERLLLIIGIATFVVSLRGNYFDHAFYISGKTAAFSWIMLVTAVLNIAFCLLLIPRLGVDGAAYATLISYSASLVLGIVLGGRHFAMPIPWAEVAKTSGAAAAMAVTLLTLPLSTEPAALLWKIPLGALVFGACVLATNTLGLRGELVRRLGGAGSLG